MFGTLGGGEILLIFVIALIVFGPRKLPEIGKSLGKMMVEFRRASNDFRRTVEEEVEADKLRHSLDIGQPAAPAAGGAPVPAPAGTPEPGATPGPDGTAAANPPEVPAGTVAQGTWPPPVPPAAEAPGASGEPAPPASAPPDPGTEKVSSRPDTTREPS